MAASMSKASAGYRRSEKRGERCGLCSMFRYADSREHPVDYCTLVKGEILVNDVCDYFEAVKV